MADRDTTSFFISKLQRSYREVRGRSIELARLLTAEDQCIQSMPDASPTKWHLAHTTWFFETVVLMKHVAGYVPFNEKYQYLFNSYYEALGPRHARPMRGLLSRPSVEDVHRYRHHVDEAMLRLIATAVVGTLSQLEPIIVLGLNHEQQHQELLLTDILHAFSCNPMRPAYASVPAVHADEDIPGEIRPVQWLRQAGGVFDIGFGGQGFAFDNESPRHKVLLRPYEIAASLVSNGEFADFVADGGYERPEFWLSDGWAMVQREGLKAPAYWIATTEPAGAPCCLRVWEEFGLQGWHPLVSTAAVCHISFYEAAAYAEWAGARLPTEFEWEAAFYAPGIRHMTGHVWQWTRSSYDPYPGFRPLTGAAAEYNGKFMVGQQVLRGGSIATPKGHTRPTYRNFFPPATRWQFSGVRLVRDI
ncbi:ergothioneine biosynthesis protein EgtB [Paraburkholderia sp. RL18-101-BIB-B]|uniref:ergothioneine biosynthesis protein EgtB n=1 Tax=Paraburkholderia sp. RL18-101-BIB-B TaxID=3031634 RepID=UPI0038B87B62